MSRQSVQESTVRSTGIWSICFLATVCLFLVSSCGGGGGSSSSAPSPTTGTLFTTSDSDSVTLARVSGTTITVHSVDLFEQEVFSGTATLSGNTFSMSISLYPPGGATVGSATGSIDPSGNSITATGVGGTITLTKTTSSLAGGYLGTYSKTPTPTPPEPSGGTFVAGIDGSGNVRGFAGNDAEGWSTFVTTLSGSSFTATTTNGTSFTGSISGAASGTWTKPNPNARNGTFTGPKVF